MNGYINIFKPTGMTSSNVVSKVRYFLHMKKVGHAGTLDPAAVGVLPIMLGKATKMFDYLNFEKKIYTSEFTFGKNTDTLDAEGIVTETSDVIPTKDDVLEAIKNHFLGKISQVPPKVSAISIGGKRAYDLARQGKEFNIPPREVTIFSFDLVRQTDKKSYLFTIECAKGTYIRSLCRDLAKQLNSCAYISFLSREQSGYFTNDSAITLEELEAFSKDNTIENHIVKMDAPLNYMEALCLDKEHLKTIINGGRVKMSNATSDNIRVYCNNSFIGIGGIKDEYVKIKKVFYEGNNE